MIRPLTSMSAGTRWTSSTTNWCGSWSGH